MPQVPVERCEKCGCEPRTVDGQAPPGVRVLLVRTPGVGTVAVFHQETCEMVPPPSLLWPGPDALVWMGESGD